MKVYVDGELYNDANMNDWQKPSTIALMSDTKVVAIECEDVGSQEGILASTNDGMLTDGSWKCSPEAVDGWTSPEFDDSAWAAPKQLGLNGMAPWGNVPGISKDAQWIWPEGGDALAYCRKTRAGQEDRTLSATCDDKMLVYLDGAQTHDDNMDHWNKVSNVKFVHTIMVLGIECTDVGGRYGILGSTADGILTDGSWKCSGELQNGWSNPDFDDSSWEAAAVLEDNGNVEDGISEKAQWIWSTGGEATTYCRKVLNVKDASVGTLEVTSIDIETQEEKTVMKVEGDHGDIWVPLALPMSPFNRLTALRIKGIIGDDIGTTYGDIAVDDISFRNEGCFAPPTTQPPTTSTTPQPHIPKIECNFEVDWCNWKTDDQWFLSTGEVADHTTSEASGQFAAADLTSLPASNKAKLQLTEPIKILNDADTHCLQFYYKLDSPLGASLDLNLQTSEDFDNGQEGRVHWEDIGAGGLDWRLGQYEVNRERAELGVTYYLLFISRQEGTAESGIAYLDDITYSEGVCPTINTCTFETSDICGWHAQGEDQATWERMSTHDELCVDCPSQDHTYHTNQGHFMAVRSLEQAKRATLISPLLEAHDQDWCMKLFFATYDPEQNELFQVNIYVRVEGQATVDLDPILSLNYNVYPNSWIPLLVPMVATQDKKEVRHNIDYLTSVNIFILRLFWKLLCQEPVFLWLWMTYRFSSMVVPVSQENQFLIVTLSEIPVHGGMWIQQLRVIMLTGLEEHQRMVDFL